MEINVNTVYTTVLSIINKEQRGYITPYEFNNLATQVQLDIFESYFENLNQQLRSGGNSSEYADRVKLLQEKISKFETFDNMFVSAQGVGDLNTLSSDVYRLGTIEYTFGSDLPVELEEVTSHEFNLLRRSKLTSPSTKYPVYYKNGMEVKISPEVATGGGPSPGGAYTVRFIKKPKDVRWGYTVGALGQFIYDPTPFDPATLPTTQGSTNFEIDGTDQTEVILKILMYAGVIIKDPEIIQAASGQAQLKDQLQSS